jgi:DNA (cytosine-5)-methyltransferase 1
MKVGTDFSGIGSPEMALKMLSIEHEQVFACEIDKYARKSFEAVHGSPKTFYNDITKRDHSEVPQLDLYCAGFPCQAFSIAGKRKGFEDTRGTLFFNVAEFIKINQPKCFILENVKGLLSHDGGKTFQTIISLLTDNGGTANGQMFIPYFEDGLGYHVYYKVLNTKDFGIPQNRERIFLVGFKEFREFNFPKPFPLELRLKDMLQDNPDYKYFLSDKLMEKLTFGKKGNYEVANINKGGQKGSVQSIHGQAIGALSATDYKLPKLIIDDKYFLSDKMLRYFQDHNERHQKKGTGFSWKPKDGSDVANALRANGGLNATDNSIKVPSATKKGYEEAKDGDNISFSVPNSKTRRGRVGKGVAQTLDTACNQAVVKQLNPSKESGGKQPYQQNRVYDTDGLSPALNAHLSTGGNMINTYRIRRLTPLECWRLQGFPDAAFIKAQAVNSDTQLYKQAGNSITVNVMMELFNKIY